MKTNKLNFKLIWLISPAVVAAWILVMFFIKDVYPFGNGTIVGYDLLHGGVPVIYYVWDVIHSGDFSRIFYDFTSACGFARESLFSILHPQFWFYFLWEREDLANAVSVLFILKMVAIAFTSSYAFSKIFPNLKAPWLTVVSVMYTFCGFNLLYFTNIDWLDTVALYPLLIVFTLNLFKGKSKMPFFLTLTYLLTFSLYMSFFIVISLVVFGGLYIYIIEEKQNRKKVIFNLGVGTGASLLASAYFIFVYAKGVFSTARFDEGSYVLDGYSGEQEKLGGFLGILNAANEIDIVSVFMFLGMSLAIASLIVMWVHFKKHKDSRKYTVFFTITTILFVLQVVFKAVMLTWHFGSYQKFPFRNGYMVAFFCCCIVGYYFSRFGSLEGVKTKLSVVNFFTFVPAFFAAIAIASYANVFIFALTNNFMVLNDYIKFQTGTVGYPYACLAIAAIIGFLLIKLISFEKLRKLLTLVLVMVLVGINSFCLVAECSYPQENGMYPKEMELRANFEQKDVLSRVVNNDGILMLNYPYISGVSAISNWTHSLQGNHLKAFSDLGFCSYFTYVYDMGGTVFSRALLRVTDTVSESKLDKNLYKQYKETDLGMKYYSNNYNLPVGMTFDESVKEINADDYDSLFEYQNDIYKASGGKGDLFEKVEYKSTKEKVKKEKVYVNKEKEDGSGKGVFIDEIKLTTTTFTFDVDEKSVLYMHNADKNEDFSFVEMSINGEKFHVYDGSSVAGSEVSFNTKYPNDINTGILELGVFENETVKVIIKFSPKSSTENVAMYCMDLNKMSQLSENQGNNEYSVDNGSITFTTKGKQGDIAFIPLSYDANWKCTVNGQAVEPECVLGNFMGVKIAEGENKVEMKLSVKPAFIGYLLRIVLFVLGLLVILIEKKIKKPGQIYTLTFIVFTAIFIGGLVVVYVLPVGWSVVTNLIALFKG